MLTFNIVADGITLEGERIPCYADDVYLQWFPLRDGSLDYLNQRKKQRSSGKGTRMSCFMD